MAVYRLSAKIISRKAGHSAVAAAAYRSGSSLKDERAGEVRDYSTRAHAVVFEGVFAPKDAPDWARDREQLWNHVEGVEKRKDAQLAREIQLSLPHEMTDQQREWLVKDFVREQFTRRGLVVDAAIHAPDRRGDERNHHAHLMVTQRTIDADGFAATKDRSLNSKEQLGQWREEWAHLANRHLERHGIEARIDHRSHADRGLEDEPTKYEGPSVTAQSRQGIGTDRRAENDEIRLRNADRAQVRYAEKLEADFAAGLVDDLGEPIIRPTMPGRDDAQRFPAERPDLTPPPDLWPDRADEQRPNLASAAAGRDDLVPPADLWERGGDAPAGMPASIARQLAPDMPTGLDAPPDLWDRDEAPEVAPTTVRRPAAALDPEHDWTSRGGMVAQQASAAIWARDAERRAAFTSPQRPVPRHDAPTVDDTNREQAAERDQLAASPIATEATQAARMGEALPAPASAPTRSAQDIERERYMAAFDRTYAQNLQEREQSHEQGGGRELDR